MQEISNTFLWSFNRQGRERESNVASILGNVRIELPSSQCEKTGEVDGSMSIDERLPSSTSSSLGPFFRKSAGVEGGFGGAPFEGNGAE